MAIAMSPAYDAGDALWYAAIADSPAQIKLNPMIGALTLCDIAIPPCVVKGESSTYTAPIANTLTGCPAIIAPSYQDGGVKVLAPRIIGDALDSKGRVMPRYKS
jgi:hypothetical protein